MCLSRFVKLALLILCCLGGTAMAHEIRPAIVTTAFTPNNRYSITIIANIEALLAGIGPEHIDSNDSPVASQYNQLRALPPDELRSRIEAFAPRWLDGIQVEFDGTRVPTRVASIEVPNVGDLGLARLSTVTLAGDIPDGATSFRWRYASQFGSSVLRVRRAGAADDQLVTNWLKDGAMSEPIPLAGAEAKTALTTFAEYVWLGFTHILPFGLDHILFVLGLYLLSTQVRPLLVQVTAFTVAHSITLALGLYGVVSISPDIVEPLIAASIVFIAVENLVTSSLTPWRPFVVFGFGLIHGLGFAGILQEIGLPRADYLIGLIAFNVGVELGQLAVITLAFAATGLWFRTRPWYRTRVVWPASAAIAAVGLFWTVERVFAG